MVHSVYLVTYCTIHGAQCLPCYPLHYTRCTVSTLLPTALYTVHSVYLVTHCTIHGAQCLPCYPLHYTRCTVSSCYLLHYTRCTVSTLLLTTLYTVLPILFSTMSPM